MKRTLVAAAWITGATVPLLLATVFVVGCCVLPFHGVVHKIMPLCDMAIGMMRGEPDAGPEVPASEKQEPVKRIVTKLPAAVRLAAVTASQRVLAPAPASSYRSFLSHGAMRCDSDVGLHILDATLLI